MKRLVYSFSAVALMLGFNACEGHNDEELPPHYQERMGVPTAEHKGAAEGAKHEGGEKAGEHAKPGEGEPKAH